VLFGNLNRSVPGTGMLVELFSLWG